MIQLDSTRLNSRTTQKPTKTTTSARQGHIDPSTICIAQDTESASKIQINHLTQHDTYQPLVSIATDIVHLLYLFHLVTLRFSVLLIDRSISQSVVTSLALGYLCHLVSSNLVHFVRPPLSPRSDLDIDIVLCKSQLLLVLAS